MNFIEIVRENTNTNYLIERLVSSGWMGKDVVLVNCAPEYSSRLTQLVNHKTSYLNGNELYEQVSLELPKKGMNQIYDYENQEYIPFDKYLGKWMKLYFDPSLKYLFITNTIFTGRNLNKVRLEARIKTDNLDNIKFLCLYAHEQSKLVTDFTGRLFPEDYPPVFFWENTNQK